MPDKHCWQTSHTQSADYTKMAAEVATEIAALEKRLDKLNSGKHLGAQAAQDKGQTSEMLIEAKMRYHHYTKKAAEQNDTGGCV